MPTYYPLVEDVESFLAAAKYTLNDDIDLQTPLQATIEDWGNDTGWNPFQGTDEADVAVLFDPPQRGYLYFGDDSSMGPGVCFQSITSVTSGVYGSSAGTVLVENQDYWLVRSRDQLAITGIRFRSRPGCYPLSLQVLGRRGRVASIPSAVFLAILAGTADKLSPHLRRISPSAATPLVEERYDEVLYKYGTLPTNLTLTDFADIYAKQAKSTTWKRMEMG